MVMNTVVVWVLVIWMGTGGHGGGPAIVDNIDSKRNCEAIGLQIESASELGSVTRTRCFAVRKITPTN